MVGLMNQNFIKVGMKVKIARIEDTHKKHSSCAQMERMVGKTYRIKIIKPATSSYVMLHPGDLMFVVDDRYSDREYVWSAEDLDRVEPIPDKPKKATFNPENIVRL